MLSLVIGCLNEVSSLQDTISQALELSRPPGGLEISIFDDGSTDGTTAFLDHEPWLEHRRQGLIRLQRSPVRQGISRGRYKAALGCRGDVLIFMDAHLSFPQPDLWLQVADHFARDRSDLLALDCRDPNGAHSCASFFYTSRRLDHLTPDWISNGQAGEPQGAIDVPYVNGGFFAIRRSVYERLKGFPLFLQGWGHEDRYLSTLAGYLGYRCAADHRLIVYHQYKSSFGRIDVVLPPCTPCADPLPAGGVPSDLQLDYQFAEHGFDVTQVLLMNSLRCGQILYSVDTYDQLVAQLRTQYHETVLAPVLAALRAERPQLQSYLSNLGINALQRDEAMRLFFARWNPALPMLVEAGFQAARSLPPAQALEQLQALPLRLTNLAGRQADEFSVARLYAEADAASQLGDYHLVISRLTDLLAIQPDYLPALRVLTAALRALGRTQAYRHWLEHANAVIEHHQASYGPGPLAAHHPACANNYLNHLYFPEADRAIWSELAELEISEEQPARAARWLFKLLEQTPGDEQVLARLASLHSQPVADPAHG